MTANRRIFLNIVATYGRSLYALVIGLFCGRWSLMALGEVDYGLVGVIGGLVGFLGFLNSIMSGSIGRFFAVSIGEEIANPKEGLVKCRRWFTAAVVVSTTWPIVVVAIGYPIGHWAVVHYLNVPPDRIASCVWVWRFVCMSFIVSMVSVPFNAMYTAKQYIAELTIYSFVTTTLNAVFLYYMVSHPGDWLARYSFWTCLLSVIPMTIIAIRAFYIFPECRVVRDYLNCWGEIKQMLTFSGWTMISSVGGLLANQGCAIMINKKFGPTANAGVNVGTSLSGHAETLGGCLIGAFSPAIMNAYGAGEIKLMERLVYRVSKIGVICMLIFAIPLSLEVDKVLLLWLKDPPRYAAGCCILAMLHAVIDKMSIGHLIAINAKGVIAKFQAYVGSAWLIVLPLAYCFILLGGGVYSALMALILARIYAVLARVWFARQLLALRARDWVKKVLFPISALTVTSYAFGWAVTYLMEQSFIRVVVTTCSVEVFLLPAAWFFALDSEERAFVQMKIKAMIHHAR